MTEPTLARARAGDQDAFAALTDPYRRELQLHCYRMLGSLQDAEDALQETLVSAWRGLDRFEERASLRAWLYRIATNRCLNFLRDSERRPRGDFTLPFEPPAPTRLGELPWLQPYPDELLDATPGPEARYETREAVGLAYITALQRLPERQRAVLVLRDALGFSAAEVAGMLDTSEPSVNSALQRARAALAARMPPRERAPAPGSARERELVSGFADAFEAGDIERVVALLTDDAWVTMPPEPHEYQGREAIADFLYHASAGVRRGRRTILVPTRANGQPALAQYIREPGAPAARAAGVFVLTLEADGISMLTRFDGGQLVSRFGLPETVRDDRTGGTAGPPAGSR